MQLPDGKAGIVVRLTALDGLHLRKLAAASVTTYLDGKLDRFKRAPEFFGHP